MYTVVVADDEAEVRQALIRKVAWEETGFRVVGEAENGAEALELVEKLEPDLLLTDIKMPFMSGIELAREVREIRPTMQIAFLSGFDDFSYAQQAIQYNIVSYLLKPISSKKMTEELTKIKAKIDHRFEEIAEWTKQNDKSDRTEFLIPLILDQYPEDCTKERNQRLKKRAAETGLLRDGEGNFLYTVMVTSFLDKSGENCTIPGSVNAVDSVLKKYVNFGSFFSEGRVISLISATPSAMRKYLHILVEEIAQGMERITGMTTMIGVSRETDLLTGCHDAYIGAMKALRYDDDSGNKIHFLSDIEQMKSGSDLCDQALEIIRTRYRESDLSLVAISNEIAVTPNYLSSLIKKITGHTFVELLTGKRIEVARELLMNSSLKIREIAELCGYNDQHYFSYSFKKATGLSPNACRKQTEEG